jgi:Matrixin
MLMTALLSIASSFAFTVKQTDTGEPLRWRSFPVPFTWAGGAPPEVADPEADVLAAFQSWEEITGTEIAFSAAPDVDGEPVEAPDGVNWVWVSDDWPFEPELLALTSSWTRVDGTLIAFDIRLNGTRQWASDGRADAYDFRAAVAHEIGHVLGLDHSEVEEATMFATSGMGESWRAELAHDDEDGARFLYPYQGPVPVGPLGCSTQPLIASGGGLLLAGFASLRRSRRAPHGNRTA